MSVPAIALNDGNSIPQLGLGVYQATGGDEISAVTHALANGYTHIDTASIYKNESGVGQGIIDSGLARSDIYLTTKVWNDDIRDGKTGEAIERSLARLKTDYVDLLLLHWPVDGRLAAWKALISAREQGQVRSIGVSNFLPEHLDELVNETGVVPAINQIEYHPYLTQPAIVEACNKHGVIVEAWSPLMRGHFKEEAVFASLAASYDKSAAQVILRWAIQKGVVIIPKSVTPSRIDENAALFDFELSAADMAQIDALERDGRLGPDPANFDF